MVPFSFENIARSASLDAPKASPVSAAARATHETFESHLKRATAPAIDPRARQPAPQDKPREQSESRSNERPRNEPVRQDDRETRRDDVDNRESGAAEAPTANEVSVENDEEDTEQEISPDDETGVIAVTQDVRAAGEEAELEVTGDSTHHPDKVAVNNRAAVSHAAEESETGDLLEADAGVSVDEDKNSTDRSVKQISSETAGSESHAHRAKPSDTNEEVPPSEFLEETEGGETTIEGNEPAKAGKTPRRGNRNEIAASQTTRDTPDTAVNAITTDVAGAAVDVARDDGSRQHQGRRDADVPQPSGNATAGESTTTTTGTPSRFAQHLLARTDDPAARGLNITNADQSRFVDRVARAVQATGERGGTLRLRLSPPELGALTLEVKVQGGVVSARVEADTPAARTLLLENLSVLRERLAEYGMRVDQFDVDLSDRQAGGLPDGLQQNDQQQEERPRTNTKLNESDDAAPASDNTMPTKNGNEQLNIIV